MANQKIFCSVPWTNHHFYWDGSYGVCSSESKRPETQQNLNNTSLIQWYNSDTMQNFRQRILSDQPLPECSSCYKEEAVGYQSRRIKENYKLGIFTEHTDNAFQHSFQQSSWHGKFTENTTNQLLPIDWHVDLGNECNFACKMCIPEASSKIANAYKSWDIEFDKKPNWVNNNNSWQQLLKNVSAVKERLNRIHIIGGEPLVNKKFYQLIDWLLENQYQHVSISVVTNGTNVTKDLIDKLKQFRLVHFEISAESVNHTNDYIRQGCDYVELWETIDFVSKQQTDNFQLVLRAVPQLLSVNNYHEYILKAHQLGLAITSIPLSYPEHMAVNVLPWDIRQDLKLNYQHALEQLQQDTDKPVFQTIALGRDASRLTQTLSRECEVVIKMLDSKTPDNVDQLRTTLVQWLLKWDKKYNYNALALYPQYKEFFKKYGYSI
jgi:organic radical activating enzyme|tara:strand:+ start:1449 stop:2753 length:1305 start_codon:yes stop_codon:yes gene_type:complete